MWDETAAISEVIWVGREEEIFLPKGLDGKIKARLICPAGCFRRRCPLTLNRYRNGRLSSINPVGKHPARRSGCYLGRRQVASLDRRISTATNHNQGTIMLRMMLLGLLIPLGVGALAAMELRTPPRTLVTVVQPVAETTAGISDSHAALAKADRLEITYAKSETPTQPDPVDERILSTEATTIGSPEAPRIVNNHRHDPKTKKVATATLPKSKPKTTDIKRMAARERSKAAGDTEPCRLSAFGGLRKALNSSDCEI
jgi:hypothetical protein